MITEKNIRQLIETNGDLKISITLPTHKVGSDRQQNPIRFKNLLSNASDELASSGLKEKEIEKLLKPATELLSQPFFWSEMEQGMAVYLTPDYFEVFKLPYELSEMVYIQDHFLVTPLLPMTSTDGTYCILAISLKKSRLLRCTRTTIADITPEDIPGGINEWLGEKPEAQLQFHTGTNEGENAMFFGHGASGEEEKELIEQYLRDVERAITPAVSRTNDPMILFGLEKNLGMYQKINHYSRIIDRPIDHNPDELSDEKLRDRGWEVIRDHFLNELFQALETYRDSAADRVSNDPSEIITSTVMGKTGAIFIAKDSVRWGTYDADNHKVLFRNQPKNSDVELMNWLSIKGFETGSDVYVLPKTDMPDQAEVAALFRF